MNLTLSSGYDYSTNVGRERACFVMLPTNSVDIFPEGLG
jgi:hypothetical protein